MNMCKVCTQVDCCGFKQHDFFGHRRVVLGVSDAKLVCNRHFWSVPIPAPEQMWSGGFAMLMEGKLSLANVIGSDSLTLPCCLLVGWLIVGFEYCCCL